MRKKKDKPPEQLLCEQVRIAEALCFPVGQAKVIEGDLIRRLALSLPRPGGTGACPLTPFGIRIVGATIKGDIRLDRAVPPNGGALCPIEFERCDFIGRFSGVHARFSRLGFRDCTFQYPPGKAGGVAGDIKAPEPTIDLTGASLDADLHLVKVRPEGMDTRRLLPRARGNHMWIRLVGARIDGELDLCDCHLRAPPQRSHLISENAEDALDLTLAEISGDLQLVGCCRIEGRIKMRAAHIRGDVWMSGAEIDNPGDEALFMQGARVEGLVMLDGRFERRGDAGRFRRFKCVGAVSLVGTEIGRSLNLNHAVMQGGFYARNLTVRDDVVLDGEFSGPIDLSACRIGGSLDISGLNLGAPATSFSLNDGTIGRSLNLAHSELSYKLREARSAKVTCIDGFDIVETLWELTKGEPFDEDKDIPPDRRWVQAAFLVERRGALRGRIIHLDGHADTFERAVPLGFDLDEKTVVEYARLRGAYVQAADGSVRLGRRARVACRWSTDPERRIYVVIAIGVRDDSCRLWRLGVTPGGTMTVSPAPCGRRAISVEKMPRLRNGLLVRAPLERREREAKVAARTWLARPALPGMTEVTRWFARERELAAHIDWNPLLQAKINLEGLTCDMLDDDGGRAWGEHSDRIKMNHFVYRRAKWPEVRPRRHGRQKLRSYRKIVRWLRSARADFLGPAPRGREAERLRDHTDHLEPWQARRNWIYRQFELSAELASPARHRIREKEYQSQPFSQATAVARAEGREDIATHFEMLKQHNEWRISNERLLVLLSPIAIILASSWLVLHKGNLIFTIFACLATVVTMVLVTDVNDAVERLKVRPIYRRLAVTIFFYFPALALLAFDRWGAHPFHYFVAFAIFLTIRRLAHIADWAMHWMFGYLRRPGRAVVTLIGAFVLGWLGVNAANSRDMLVVDSSSSATVVGPHPGAVWPYGAPPGHPPGEKPLVPGTIRAVGESEIEHEVSCAPIVSEPLYALDILVPIVDLHEEEKCEVRRLAERPGPGDPNRFGWGQLIQKLEPMTLDSHRFWWWMKALYALAGWFIVSLALLTFAQVFRTRGEMAEE